MPCQRTAAGQMRQRRSGQEVEGTLEHRQIAGREQGGRQPELRNGRPEGLRGRPRSPGEAGTAAESPGLRSKAI